MSLGEVGKIAIGNQDFENEGYRNVMDDLNLLQKDEKSLMSLLPQELISQVGKCILYNKLKVIKKKTKCLIF